MPTPERSARARAWARQGWRDTADRTARTRPGREKQAAKFEREADPDGTLTPEERAVKVAELRSAYFRHLAQLSAESRRLHSWKRRDDDDV